MPLADFHCKDCDYFDMDKYFHTRAAMDAGHTCPICGELMDRMAPLICFHGFQEFTTRNLIPDGSEVRITSRNQLESLKKRYGVREALVNHNMYGGDVRSVPLNPGLPSKTNPMRKRKAANRISVDEAKAIQQQAERTNYGTRRA